MNWSDAQSWKNTIISTLICLVGCSIGAMGLPLLFAAYSWLFILMLSFISGFISCLIFICVWNFMFRKMTFKDALLSSFKMSFVSMLIMIAIENLILFLVPMQNSMHHQHGSEHNIPTMIFAMCCGFVFALPYNYYQVQKTGKLCH